MKYDIWTVDSSGKTTLMRNYANYKSAKSVAKLFAKDNNIHKVVILAREDVKDQAEEDE